MSNQNQWNQPDDDNEDEGQSQSKGGGGLRAQLEKALEENKKLTDRAKKAEAAAREAAIAGVLRAKEINPKVAKLLPPDIEPTEDAINKWLDEYGDVFSITRPEDKPGGDDDAATTDDGNADLAAQMGRMAGATSAAKPPTKEADLLAKLQDPNLTRDQLDALVTGVGGGYGVG